MNFLRRGSGASSVQASTTDHHTQRPSVSSMSATSPWWQRRPSVEVSSSADVANSHSHSEIGTSATQPHRRTTNDGAWTARKSSIHSVSGASEDTDGASLYRGDFYGSPASSSVAKHRQEAQQQDGVRRKLSLLKRESARSQSELSTGSRDTNVIHVNGTSQSPLRSTAVHIGDSLLTAPDDDGLANSDSSPSRPASPNIAPSTVGPVLRPYRKFLTRTADSSQKSLQPDPLPRPSIPSLELGRVNGLDGEEHARAGIDDSDAGVSIASQFEAIMKLTEKLHFRDIKSINEEEQATVVDHVRRALLGRGTDNTSSSNVDADHVRLTTLLNMERAKVKQVVAESTRRALEQQTAIEDLRRQLDSVHQGYQQAALNDKAKLEFYEAQVQDLLTKETDNGRRGSTYREELLLLVRENNQLKHMLNATLPRDAPEQTTHEGSQEIDQLRAQIHYWQAENIKGKMLCQQMFEELSRLTHEKSIGVK